MLCLKCIYCYINLWFFKFDVFFWNWYYIDGIVEKFMLNGNIGVYKFNLVNKIMLSSYGII